MPHTERVHMLSHDTAPVGFGDVNLQSNTLHMKRENLNFGRWKRVGMLGLNGTWNQFSNPALFNTSQSPKF